LLLRKSSGFYVYPNKDLSMKKNTLSTLPEADPKEWVYLTEGTCEQIVGAAVKTTVESKS
jgi:hypothetical protein